MGPLSFLGFFFFNTRDHIQYAILLTQSVRSSGAALGAQRDLHDTNTSQIIAVELTVFYLCGPSPAATLA